MFYGAPEMWKAWGAAALCCCGPPQNEVNGYLSSFTEMALTYE